MPYSSDLTVGGIATASSEHPTTYNVTKAFDNDLGTKWMAQATTSPQWIKYQLPTAKAIGKIRLRPVYTNSILLVKNFKLYGSNDDTNWTLLLTDATSVNVDQWFEYIFPNTTTYLYYKFDIIDHWYTPFSGYFTEIVELEMMELLPLLKAVSSSYDLFNRTLKPTKTFYRIGHKVPITKLSSSNYSVIQSLIRTTSFIYPIKQVTKKITSSTYLILGTSSKSLKPIYSLFPPKVEFYGDGNILNVIPLGQLKSGVTSQEFLIKLWNNKTDPASLLEMSEVFLGVKLIDGGNNAIELQLVSEKWIEIKSSGVEGSGITDDAQATFTPVGNSPSVNGVGVGDIATGTARHLHVRLNIPASIITGGAIYPLLLVEFKPSIGSSGFGINFGFNFGN